ncbi:MAG TPA: HipA family kinase [Candidatus Solibacter sp.]|nr:HipA family kinase [Candidatus Solibacter sp.]
MRGGAQSHLMRCDNGEYYVVKFQNNPQHRRVLVNELLGTKLAERMGLPVPPVDVVEVRRELIENTAELVMQVGNSRAPCSAGRQFGSRYPGEPAETAVHDFLPDEQLGEVENLDAFAGMFAFDKWTCNTNGRQAIFFRGPGRARYQAWMIDQGFCFNAQNWDFPDAPLRGLYARARVYDAVRGMDAFEPWTARMKRMADDGTLDEMASQVPAEWYEADLDALYALLERLVRRIARLPELIVEARNSYRRPFRNWT